MTTSIYREIESKTINNFNLRCIDGSIHGCSKCVGYCAYTGHAGFLTADMEVAHDCINKGCHYHHPKPEAPKRKKEDGTSAQRHILEAAKEAQRNLLNFIKTKPVMDGLKAQKSEKARRAYREQHESDLIIYEAAKKYFTGKGVAKLPGRKALRDEIEQLTVRQNAEYNAYREKKGRVRELETIRDNIEQTLHGAPSQQKKHEQER